MRVGDFAIVMRIGAAILAALLVAVLLAYFGSALDRLGGHSEARTELVEQTQCISAIGDL